MEIRRREIYRYMGYKNGARPSEEISLMVEEWIAAMEEAFSAKSVYEIFPIVRGGDRLDIGGFVTESRDLAKNLNGCTHAAILAATAGLEVDKVIKRAQIRDSLSALICQAAGAEFIESYVNDLCKSIPGKKRPRFSPGFGDLPLTHQRDILGILDAKRRIGISLLDSFLMVPSKSVTAIMGIEGE